MKAIRNTHQRTTRACRYPNVADPKYFWSRITDIILCTVSTMGIVTVLSILITMF